MLPAPVQQTASPRIVGRYAIFDRIASGGMASVHLGRFMGPVGFARTVAIKRLHEKFAGDPQFVAMFLDEARLVARIDHPNVVPTLDVVASDQELLLVMQYVHGESLTTLLQACAKSGHKPPIPLAVDIAIGMLNGLHAAHEAVSAQGQPLNIVHRDVSPHNVLVGTDGISRVLDFGIAKAIGRSHETQDGQIKGKLRYMAPEQVKGKPVTRAADIYAASVVLWEALTCRRLFGGENDAEVVYRVLENQVHPPSRFRAGVSPELDAVLLRGFHADPARRWPTAKAMAEALEAVIAPITRSTVGNWVLQVAGDSLCEKRERVAVVESNDMDGPLPSRPPAAPASRAAVTPVETSSFSRTMLRALFHKSRSAPQLFLAVAGVVVLVSLVLWFSGSPSETHGVAAAGAPSAAPSHLEPSSSVGVAAADLSEASVPATGSDGAPKADRNQPAVPDEAESTKVTPNPPLEVAQDARGSSNGAASSEPTTNAKPPPSARTAQIRARGPSRPSTRAVQPKTTHSDPIYRRD